MAHLVTSQLASLIDFEQKSLIRTIPALPLPPLPWFLNCAPQSSQMLTPAPSPPLGSAAQSLRPLNRIQPPLLEHPRPPRIQPSIALLPTLPPQPPIRMLLPRRLHLPPRPLSRLPIRTRSPAPTPSPILSPTYTGIYTVSDRKYLGVE